MSAIPKKIYDSMRMVEAFCHQTNLKVLGPSFQVPTTNCLCYHERTMQLQFDAEFNREIYLAYDRGIGPFSLEINGTQYMVKNGHAFFNNSLQIASSAPQTFTIDIDELLDEEINEDKEYFVRLIQPLQRNRWNYGLETYVWEENRTWSRGLHIINLKEGDVHTYPVKYKGIDYLVTESLFPVTISRMQDLVYSIAVAIGLFCCRVNLDNYFIVVADQDDYTNPLGIGFKGLRPSVECQYHIFTTNMWSLEASLKRQPKTQYALAGIQDNNGTLDDNKVVPLDMVFYSNLCRNICESQTLTRVAATVIEASSKPLEYQAALYCVALESITTFVSGKQSHITPMDKSVYMDEIMPQLTKIIDSLKARNLISEEGYNILSKRISSGDLNRQANASKLTDAFNKYGYNLSRIERDCINKRNPIFHGIDVGADGDLESQSNYLFHLSIVLHKLCCILLLKLANFDNYIINNAVLFGCDEECSIQEPVLIKI